jgi:hypothetical protein
MRVGAAAGRTVNTALRAGASALLAAALVGIAVLLSGAVR